MEMTMKTANKDWRANEHWMDGDFDLNSIFPGKSEMARLMRAFDWSTSEIGIPEKWPESLKAAVRICVGSRNPIVIWWGRTALTQIYNDGYMRILTAAKHPKWLGRSGAACWSEIMETMGPLWEQVLATGEATWFEDFLYIMNRNLPREECYFTFSYSALRNDSGVIDGILCICYETSSRVIGDGRLKTLRDLGRIVAVAKTQELACKAAADILAANPGDIPFSLLYLLEDDVREARLVATSGFERQNEAGPDKIDLKEPTEHSGWPLKQVLESGSAVVVSGLQKRFGKLPGGLWPECPESAIILPITSAGQCRGFMVAGFSARRIADADYRSFFDLVAGHISTAVTNARAYEEERKRAEALAEIDRAKTAFFSNVSHEFRTPLTLMLGPLEATLARVGGIPDNVRQELAVAHRNAMRLLKLVNTLLDFSRIESGRIQASYEAVDLAQLTAELASNFRSAMERAGLRLIIHCPPLGQPVWVDGEMWEKIVLNLLSNAFKFTFEGEVEVTLTLSRAAARPASHKGAKTQPLVELRVRDTGTGIAESDLPHIFKRFHRIRGARARSHEGSGIGLSLVEELVKLHGGKIDVTSMLGKGTTFCVRIPIGSAHLPRERLNAARRQSSTALGAAPFVEESLRWLPTGQTTSSGPVIPEPRPSSEAVNFPLGTILLADDNADMRDYVRRLLTGQYEVQSVPDGQSALRAIRDHIPDLVLADIMMPGMDGLELLRAIRSDSRARQTPIILLSARAGEESKVEGLDAGADDYLVKPFTARELLARVKAHVSLAQERRRATEQAARIDQAEKANKEIGAARRAALNVLEDAVEARDRAERLNRELRASEHRFLKFVEDSAQAVWETNAAGEVVVDSPSWRACTGQTFGEYKGFGWLNAVHPDDRKYAERQWREAVASGHNVSAEFRLKHAKGGWRWTNVRAMPFLNPDGSIEKWLGINLDVRTRKNAQGTSRVKHTGRVREPGL
jgi:PAS domain S-box-containing protein